MKRAPAFFLRSALLLVLFLTPWPGWYGWFAHAFRVLLSFSLRFLGVGLVVTSETRNLGPGVDAVVLVPEPQAGQVVACALGSFYLALAPLAVYGALAFASGFSLRGARRMGRHAFAFLFLWCIVLGRVALRVCEQLLNHMDLFADGHGHAPWLRSEFSRYVLKLLLFCHYSPLLIVAVPVCVWVMLGGASDISAAQHHPCSTAPDQGRARLGTSAS